MSPGAPNHGRSALIKQTLPPDGSIYFAIHFMKRLATEKRTLLVYECPGQGVCVLQAFVTSESGSLNELAAQEIVNSSFRNPAWPVLVRLFRVQGARAGEHQARRLPPLAEKPTASIEQPTTRRSVSSMMISAESPFSSKLIGSTQ